MEHLLAAAEARQALSPIGAGRKHTPWRSPDAACKETTGKARGDKRNKYSELQQCKHWLQEQQRQSRLMGRLGR